MGRERCAANLGGPNGARAGNVGPWGDRGAVQRDHSVDQMALEQLVQTQYGVVARGQALACGMTNRMLQHRLRPGGPWQKVLPGVYLTVTGAMSLEQREMAALLHAGPRSALTGLAAARRFGISGFTGSVVDVLVPAKLNPQSIAFVRVRRTWRMPAEVCVDGPMRYAQPGRAVADAARSLTATRDVRALAAQAVQRQVCTVSMLATELEEGPRKGSAQLRAAVEEVQAGLRSVPEGDLRRVLRRSDLPMPEFNARLYCGKELVAVVDAWWEEAGVGVEADSKEYHYSAEDWQRTMERHDRLVAQGVLLLHFSPQKIRTEPGEVVERIRAALKAGRERPPLPITSRRR
jgi:very-short-patch-repair endonuclease